MNYSEEQVAILENKSRFLQVIAAAGSGKTSTMVGLLTKILQEKEEDANRILVLTFTRKATHEFKERLDRKVPNSGVKIHTFHAYCLSVLQRFDPNYQKSPALVIDEKKQGQIWKEILKEFRFQVGGIPYEFLISKPSALLDSYFPDLRQRLIKRYSEIKKKNHFLDFDDIVSAYLSGLRAQENWALHARKELSRIIIDEFQDTDLVQMEWVRLMDPEKLTVVGDDWQAIYGFRGATVEPFLQFSKSFPGASVQFLSTNYRSLPSIIHTSKLPISYNKHNFSKQILPFRKGEGYVGVIQFSDDQDWIDWRDTLMKCGVDYKIITRTNYRIARLKNLGIPEERLLTIHASKGLEFHTVFVDLTEGWTTEEDTDLEEERRILYVALSRAKDNLFILAKRKYKADQLEKTFVGYFHKLPKIDPYRVTF